MDLKLHSPEVFSMLKPNFIGIGWEINLGQLLKLKFTKNGENFGVFGPLDPQKRDFRKMNFNLHSPEVFSTLKPNFIGIGREINSGELADFQLITAKILAFFGPLDSQKCEFRKIDFIVHSPEVFPMLKPNFIGIGWETNSGQLSKLQFTKNGKNFRVFGPLDPPNAIFAKWTSTCTGPRYFLCWNQNSLALVER